MKKLADHFINRYKVSKTLRFRLIPQGKTREYIERDGILDKDYQRAENYQKVKEMMDRYHKKFIEDVLSGFQLKGIGLYEDMYLEEKENEKKVKEFDKIKKDLEKQISAAFTKDSRYNAMFKKDMVEKILPSFVTTQEEKELLLEFKGFTTYFDKFFKNRKNIYQGADIHSSIANRIINQNLPKYLDNMKVFRMICNTEIVRNLNTILAEMGEKLGISSLDVFFDTEGFNNVLTQRGIDTYNALITGYAVSDKIRVKGINEYINLYNQKHERAEHMPKMKTLFKQILSDRETKSFVLTSIQTDEELFKIVENIYEEIHQNVLCSEDTLNIGELVEQIDEFDLSGIYIENGIVLNNISKRLFSDWTEIQNALIYRYDQTSDAKKKNTAAYEKKRKTALQLPKNYSIAYLNEVLGDYREEKVHIENFVKKEIITYISVIDNAYTLYHKFMGDLTGKEKCITKNKTYVTLLKNLMDALKALERTIQWMAKGQMESAKDELFYGEFTRLWESFEDVNSVYNKVRNYVTKKPANTEKVKLNFNCATLMNGWDKNKESNNLATIFQKNGIFYLGIMNVCSRKIFESMKESDTENYYEKMEYKYLPHPHQMLPKKFIKAKKNMEKYNPSAELLEKYELETHIKGDNFNLKDCHNLIDYFKKCIAETEDWKCFDFHFSNTESYADISDFYNEVAQQGYKINFCKVDANYIDHLVENGELYLFKIYNKDFSKYSKGTPNLYTLYFKELFSYANKKDPVFKLSGNAEIFYRKSVIDKNDVFRYYKNEPIKNKAPETLKQSSVFDYDIVKNKRYTTDQFQLNLPIVMNFKAKDSDYLNSDVNRLVHDAKEMHIISVGRGKDNLLYVTVIDLQGKIKKQFSLNQIINNANHKTDYYNLLNERKEYNEAAQKSWQNIEKVKDLKEGYLSQVIHEIAQLILKYNAIVVMEDTSLKGRGTKKELEMNVYQAFEKKLINKLNFLVDKKIDPEENGGIRRAYQLTNIFESFQKIGKQTGFLYYVPSGCTDNMDPDTGFVNRIYCKYESVKKSKAFIGQIDEISYNEDQDYFEFDVDYKKILNHCEDPRTKWKICTVGTRIEYYKIPKDNKFGINESVNITKEWKDLYARYGISIRKNILTQVLEQEDKDFFEQFYRLLKLTLQMKNYNHAKNISYFVSPVMNKEGTFFHTSAKKEVPNNADAVSAYNLARKGLWLIEQIQATQEDEIRGLKLKTKNTEWIQYIQTK